ncbi:predicted protein [Plenodomus lingam JN3]|uniref:Uncharacterized protein n=1 Tax=Leptosphaeria maculans (strain JN3 / isolate v23.1.3 / race Av1-4-5-6-7-8) TaxID=985895 RepID=E5A6F0_LEPMJ|nr:predicted protein [Plenodomus lingam JN3]CBX99195.1 predicted protein [Plenodomus lingam JN3]
MQTSIPDPCPTNSDPKTNTQLYNISSVVYTYHTRSSFPDSRPIPIRNPMLQSPDHFAVTT